MVISRLGERLDGQDSNCTHTACRCARKGQGGTHVDKSEFTARFRQRFADPAFAVAEIEVTRPGELAWGGYDRYRKAPRTRKAGSGYADPDSDLSVDWIAAREAIAAAEQRRRDPGSIRAGRKEPDAELEEPRKK